MANVHDYLSTTYLQPKPQDTGFDLSDSLEKVAQGYVAGFTTFEFGDKPKNTSEAIFYNVGHLLGFMGYVPNPLGIAGKIGMTSLARALKFGKVEKMMMGAPAVFHTKSLPMFAADKIMGGIMKASALSPAAESLSFLKNQTVKDIAKGAAELGIASGVASWQQGVDGVINGVVSGAQFGAFNRFLGNMVGRGSKFSPGTQAFPTDPKQAELVDNMTRALSSSIFMGMQSTMAGAPLELQVYEYLLNGVFGYREMPWWKRDAMGVLRQYDRPGYRHKLFSPKDGVVGYDKLEPRVREELDIQSALLNGGAFDKTYSNASAALAGPLSELTKKIKEDGGDEWATLKAEASWHIYEAMKESKVKNPEASEEHHIAIAMEQGPKKFAERQEIKNLFAMAGFSDPASVLDVFDAYKAKDLELSDRFDKSGVSKYFRENIASVNGYFAKELQKTNMTGSLDVGEVGEVHQKTQDVLLKHLAPKADGTRLKDADWDGLVTDMQKTFPDVIFDKDVPAYRDLRKAFVEVKDAVPIPILQWDGTSFVPRPPIDANGKKNTPVIEPEMELHRMLPPNEDGTPNNVIFIQGVIDPALTNNGTLSPTIYEAIDKKGYSLTYDAILHDLASKKLVFYGGIKDKSTIVAGNPYISDMPAIQARWDNLSKVFPELQKDMLEYAGKDTAKAKVFKFHAVNNAEFAKKFNGIESDGYESLNNKDIINISPQKLTKRMQIFATRNPRYSTEGAVKAGLPADGVRFGILNAVNKDGSGHFGGLHETYLDQDGKPKAYDQGWDGGTFVSHKTFDALIDYFGLEPGTGFIKGLQANPGDSDKLGFLSKLGFHRASDLTNEIMESNNWQILHFDTTAKQAGGRKAYDWEYTPDAEGKYKFRIKENGQEVVGDSMIPGQILSKYMEEGKQYAGDSPEFKETYQKALTESRSQKFTHKLPWESLNVSFGEDNHTMDLVKQILTNIDPTIPQGKRAADALSNMLLARFRGDDAENQKFRDNFENDAADIDFEKVGLNELVSYFYTSGKPTKMFDKFMRHIFKLASPDKMQFVEDKPEESTLTYQQDILQQSGSFEELSPFVKQWTPAIMRSAHGIREYVESAFTRYIISRAVAPRMDGSLKSTVQPHDPGSVMKLGGIKEGYYYLGDNHKKSKFALPDGSETTYEQAYKKVLAGELDPSVLDHTVVRVPADSPSGVRILKFGGFTGIRSYGTMVHHKEYSRLGGADNDGDSVFIYQNLGKDVTEYFRSQKDRNRVVNIGGVVGERPIKDPRGVMYGGDLGLFIDPTKDPGKTPFNPVHYLEANHWSHNGNAALGLGLNTMDSLLVIHDMGRRSWQVKDDSGNVRYTVNMKSSRGKIEDIKAKFVQYGADASDGTPIYPIKRLLENSQKEIFDIIPGTESGENFNMRYLDEMKMLVALNRAVRGDVKIPSGMDPRKVKREVTKSYKFTNAMAEFKTALDLVKGRKLDNPFYGTLLELGKIQHNPSGWSDVFGGNSKAVIDEWLKYVGGVDSLPFIGFNTKLVYQSPEKIPAQARGLARRALIGSDDIMQADMVMQETEGWTKAHDLLYKYISAAKEVELVGGDYEQIAGMGISAYYGKRYQESAKKSDKYNDPLFFNSIKSLQKKVIGWRKRLQDDRKNYPAILKEIEAVKSRAGFMQEGKDYLDSLLISPVSQQSKNPDTFLMTGRYMNPRVLDDYYKLFDTMVQKSHEGAEIESAKVETIAQSAGKKPVETIKQVEKNLSESTGQPVTMVNPPLVKQEYIPKFFMKAEEIVQKAKDNPFDPELKDTANRFAKFFEKNHDLLPKMEDMFYHYTYKRDGIPTPIERATKDDLKGFIAGLEETGKKGLTFESKNHYMFPEHLNDAFAPYQERNFYKRRMELMINGVTKDNVEIYWPMNDMEKINNLNNARSTAQEMVMAAIDDEIKGGPMGKLLASLRTQGVGSDAFEYAVVLHDSDMEPVEQVSRIARVEKRLGDNLKREFTIPTGDGGSRVVTMRGAAEEFRKMFVERAEKVRKEYIINKEKYVDFLEKAKENQGWLDLGSDNKDNPVSKLAIDLLEMNPGKLARAEGQLGEFAIDYLIHQSEAQHYRFGFVEEQMRGLMKDLPFAEERIAWFKKLGYVKAVDLPKEVRYRFLNGMKKTIEVGPDNVPHYKYNFLSHEEFDSHFKLLSGKGRATLTGGKNPKTGIYEPGILDKHLQEKVSKYFPRTADKEKVRAALERESEKVTKEIIALKEAGNHTRAAMLGKRLTQLLQQYELQVGQYEFGDGHQVEALASVMDGSSKTPEEMERLGMHKSSRHLQHRSYDLPSVDYEKSLDAWLRYEKDIKKKYLDKVYALTSEFVIRRFEDQTIKGKNGVGAENVKPWAAFMRIVRRDNLGYPSLLPSEFMTNPEYKIKGTPYAWTQAQYWADRYNTVMDKMGMEGEKIKDFNDLKVAHKLAWVSAMDGKLSVIGLLATPKSTISNALGGDANTVIDVGIRNFRRAFDYKLLSTFNENWTTREAVERDFQSTGIMEQFYKESANLASTAGAENVKRFFQRANEVIKKNPDAEDKTLIEIAKEEGLPDKLVEFGASFMRKAERHTRRAAAVSAYIRAREIYEASGYTFKPGEWNHPLLMDFTRRYVGASQFLYNTANRPAFARTELGKMFTRFSLWGWRSVSFRNNIYLNAKEFGFRETSEEYQKLGRMLSVDMFLMGLAAVFPFSVFNATVPPPLSHFVNLSEWMFGDQKEKEAAYFGILPYPANIFNQALPPFSRYITSFIPLMTGDMEKFSSYYMWTMLPFGRFIRDTGRALYNPSLFNERMLGIPSLTLGEYLTKVKNDKVGTKPHAYGVFAPFLKSEGATEE